MVEVLVRYSHLASVAKPIRLPDLDVGVDLRKQSDRRRPQGPGLVLDRLSTEGVKALVQAYVDGASVREVSAQYGISKPSALKLLGERGVIRRRKYFSNEDAAEAVRLYASGLSIEATGQRLGFSARTVWTALHEAGVQLRDCHGRER